MSEEPAAPRTGSVLAVFAHPDDAEISAGATMAKFADAGREVHLVILTNGDKGSGDPSQDRAELAATRREETQAAAKVLGLKSARILETPDGELANDTATRGPIVRIVRELRPETLLSCDPTAVYFENRYYNHSDHRTAGCGRACKRRYGNAEDSRVRSDPGRDRLLRHRSRNIS
jgi:LmbE family N-acetylglucosaminyl deacetylase